MKYRVKYSVPRKYKDAVIKFRSSDKKVAAISSSGLIKTRKKGYVKITAYVAKKPSVRTTVRICVGKPVKSIDLTCSQHLRPGRTASVTASVSPSTAANQKLKWTSSDPSVASVDSAGNITARSAGTTKITAKAKDGSRASKSIKIRVFTLGREDTKWISHRGVNTEAVENTAAAYDLAGQYGFWGCECDVWETKHTTVYDDATGAPVDSFDLAINHDPTFQRVWGLDYTVKDMTAEEIRSTEGLSRVCFLQEYMDICAAYGMIPVIEIKDGDMSPEAIKMLVDMVYETFRAAGDETAALTVLDEMYIISFDAPVISRVREYAVQQYGVSPITEYLIGRSINYVGDLSEVRLAKEYGFVGVDIQKEVLSDEYAGYCEENGLMLGAWTYSDNLLSDELLFQQVICKKYNIQSFTINGKLFE